MSQSRELGVPCLCVRIKVFRRYPALLPSQTKSEVNAFEVPGGEP